MSADAALYQATSFADVFAVGGRLSPYDATSSAKAYRGFRDSVDHHLFVIASAIMFVVIVRRAREG